MPHTNSNTMPLDDVYDAATQTWHLGATSAARQWGQPSPTQVVVFRTADAEQNREDALAYWEQHPTLAIGTLRQQVYAVGPLRLMTQGWTLTCPEEMAARV